MGKNRYTQFLRIDVMAESLEDAQIIISNELKGKQKIVRVHNVFENNIITTQITPTP